MKTYSSRLAPMRDVLLVQNKARIPEKVIGPKGLVEVGTDPTSGKKVVRKPGVRYSEATIIEVGPGHWENGVFIKPDERLKPGVRVLSDGAAFIQFSDVPEMIDEGLFFLSWENVIAIVEPAVEAKAQLRA